MRFLTTFGALQLAVTSAALALPADRDVRERDLLKTMVEIPTVAGRGQVPRLLTYAKAELAKAGVTDVVIKPHDGRDGDKTATLIARWKAPHPAKRPILMMAHVDVVEAKASDWTSDPFKFRADDTYFYGRGTFDMKAGAAAIVAALQRLKTSGFVPDRDLIVLFTGDEETAQEGARLASGAWKPLIDAEFALNLDAGGGFVKPGGSADHFFIQLSEKTYADYSFTATNRGGHSSIPRPDNAIYEIAGALKSLEHYRFAPRLTPESRAYLEGVADRDKGRLAEMIRAWIADPTNMEKADLVEAMLPGKTRTRCVATKIEGGHARNALPQKAEANVNCRIFPGTSALAIEKELQSVAGHDAVVKLAVGGTESDASPIRADVFDAAKAAIDGKFPGAPVYPEMSSGASDGMFTRAAGIPTYGIGFLYSIVGEPAGTHGLNERAPIRGYYDQIDILEAMLRRLAG